ncbi:hypothetical protein D3C72_2123340 [compost metagenome]
MSTLICSGQISRLEALEELKQPLYSAIELKQDTEFIRKKLGFEEVEFKAYLEAAPVSHYAYKSDQIVFDFLNKLKEHLGKTAFLSN